MITKAVNNEPLIYGNANWKVTIPPAVEPVTISELKLFARIDHDDEDSLLNIFIVAAREATENYLNKALITQTLSLSLDEWISQEIELPRSPLISVTSISIIDENDAETIYSPSNYYIDTSGEHGRIIIKQGVTLPINTDRFQAGYKIVFTAGYGAAASDVPDAIRLSIMLWATAGYENRALTSEPPPEAVQLLNRYKAIRL